MARKPATIAGFSVLPLEILPSPAYPTAATHFLYVRKNEPQIPSPSDSRSLFVTNVPVDSTAAHFRAIFSNLLGPGRFEGINFEDDKSDAASTPEAPVQPGLELTAHGKKRKREDEEKRRAAEEQARAALPKTWARKLRRSGSTAVILLVDETSVALALKAIAKLHKSKKKIIWGDGLPADDIPPLGSQWLRSHSRLSYPDKAQLQAAVDAYFTIFNREEQEAAERAKRLRSEPDADGFVTVTRGGRNAPARKTEAEEARRRMLEKQAKKKADLTNFYRFQLRERKKAEQAELLNRFHEDRRKVSVMKERRGKFRPET